MIKVYYSIEPSNKGKNQFTVWRNTKGPHSFGCKGVFTGNKKEAKLFCKNNSLPIKKSFK